MQLMLVSIAAGPTWKQTISWRIDRLWREWYLEKKGVFCQRHNCMPKYQHAYWFRQFSDRTQLFVGTTTINIKLCVREKFASTWGLFV